MKTKKQKIKEVELKINTDKQDKYFDYFAVCILVALGIYQSFILFGHKIVPISDFPAFVQTGHEILSFKCPSDFKRGPVTGILQILSGKLAGGQFPDLIGGWLLNSVLHPLNLILLWLIGKRLIGKASVWFVIIVAITPWTLYMLREPLAEIPLLFFVLLTICLICRNSSWAYLTASVTTMVRYEGAALILAAFVMDLIYRETKKEKTIAFVYSTLASVPLVLWLLGTFLYGTASMEAGEHYLTVFSKKYAQYFIDAGEGRTGTIKHLGIMWNVGFRSLFMIDPKSGQEAFETLWSVSKFTALITFAFGAIYGLIKKNRQIFVLLIFSVPYFFLHAYYPYPIPRYHSTIFWIVLLISIFGLKQVWIIVNNKLSLPNVITKILQAALLIIALFLITPLVSYLRRLSAICSVVRFLPSVVIFAVILIVLLKVFLYKFKYLLSDVAVATVMIFIILSNQFSLTSLLGDGQQDIEFKYLADWFVANAKPDEKMAVYMWATVEIFAPKFDKCFVNFPYADSPEELVGKLRQEKVTYACWASREGFSKDPYGDRVLNLPVTIPFLVNTQDQGPYKFITQIRSKRGFVNVFRLE
jgi:hypothetical protein